MSTPYEYMSTPGDKASEARNLKQQHTDKTK